MFLSTMNILTGIFFTIMSIFVLILIISAGWLYFAIALLIIALILGWIFRG